MEMCELRSDVPSNEQREADLIQDEWEGLSVE